MDEQDFSRTLMVEQTPEAVFAAINNVRGWWSEEVAGNTGAVGEVFTYRFQDVHRCTIRITELVPGERVAWHVVENFFSFIDDPSEWTGTDIIFEIARQGDRTVLHFTHRGLRPHYACFEVCSEGWGTYLGSLQELVATGKGRPNAGEPITAGERELTA